MHTLVNGLRIALAAGVLLAAGASLPDHQRVVQGYVVNIGVTPIGSLASIGAEGEIHAARPQSGAQHVMVSISDARTGRHVDSARVAVDVVDPKGTVQRQDLLLAFTGEVPDYSETFVFGWSGRYRIHVTVRSADGKSMQTEFTWYHKV